MDGVARGIDLLDAIFRTVQTEYNLIVVAYIHHEKSFDSMSHYALLKSLVDLGLPDDMLNYFKYIYRNLKTQSFKCDLLSSDDDLLSSITALIYLQRFMLPLLVDFPLSASPQLTHILGTIM